MAKSDQTVDGVVVDALGSARFRVQLHDGREVVAYVAGKMRLHHIHVFIGDKVEVVLDPAKGSATNRIVRRKK